MRRTDGTYAWVADHIHAVRDEDRNLIEVIGSLSNVSDRYAAEAANRDSEARVQAAFEQAAVDMAQLADGIVVRPNRRLLDMLGLSMANTLPTLDWAELTHPEDKKRDLALLRSLRKGLSSAGSLDKRLVDRQDCSTWVYVTYSSAASADDGKHSVFAVVEDISERRRIQGAANQALSTLDAIAEVTFSFAPKDITFFYVNEGAIKQTGYSRAELITMSWLDLQSSNDGDRFAELLAAAMSRPRSSYRFETTLHCKDGSALPVEVALRYISDTGEPPYFVAVARDVTERLQCRSEKAMSM